MSYQDFKESLNGKATRIYCCDSAINEIAESLCARTTMTWCEAKECMEQVIENLLHDFAPNRNEAERKEQ